MTRTRYESLCPVREGFQRAFVESFEDLGQVERAAYELSRNHPVDHVIAPTEKSVVAAGWIRTLLGVPGPGVEQSFCSAHKRAMKHRLREHGIAVADFEQVGSVEAIPQAAGRLRWPVVVKPVLGSGAKATHRLASEGDYERLVDSGALDALARRGLPIQVERLVPLRAEYHCDGIVRDGEVRRQAVARYVVPPLDVQRSFLGSYLVDSAGSFAGEVLDLHAKVVAALGLVDGVTHMEVFDTEAGPVVGEVAIRPGGVGIARCWHHAFGIDMWDEFVRAALGEPHLPPPPARPGVLHGWLQLPAPDHLPRLAAQVRGVIEVRSPAPTAGPGFAEVYFAGPDAAALQEIENRLCELAGHRR
jgi:biotin carboxylase